MKHYLHEIRYPVDGVVYEYVVGDIPNNAKLFTETINGTKEEIKITVENGLAKIEMPVWVTNPSSVRIGYELEKRLK